MAKQTKAEKQAELAAKETAKTAPVQAPKVEEPAAPKEPGKIEQILTLHKEGKTNAEIVALGFNKTTVAIQIAKYKKANGGENTGGAQA